MVATTQSINQLPVNRDKSVCVVSRNYLGPEDPDVSNEPKRDFADSP